MAGQWRSSHWTVLQPFWTGPQCWVCWEDWHHYNGTGYSIFHWVQLSCRCQMDVMVIDGHCHLDMLAWEWKTSAEGAIQRTLQQAPDRRMHLHAVVSNCCFPQFRRQIPQVSPAVGVRVALTFGAVLMLLAVKWTGSSWTPWSGVRTVLSESVACTALDVTLGYRRWCFIERFSWQNRSRNRWCNICMGKRGRMMKPIWMLSSCYGRRIWVVGILYTFTVSLPPGQCTWNGSAASIRFFWGWPRSQWKQMIWQR